VKLWVYVVRRFLILIPTLIGLTFLMFILTHAGGTNQVLAEYINPHLSGAAKIAAIAQLTVRFHLNDPIYVQYFYWLFAIIQGDLGVTITPVALPVTTAIVLFLPNTLFLTLVASILTWVISVPVGVYSAVRRDSALDQSVRVGSFTLYSMPVFLIGFILLLVFGLYYPIVKFPIGNLNPILYTQLASVPWFDSKLGMTFPTHILFIDAALHGYWGVAWDALLHAILPSLALTLSLMAGVVRILRASMLEVLDQDYVRLARAKGVAERSVNNLHARKNALLPTITTFGYLVAGLLGGAVVIEDIFNYKGIGWWTTAAILNGDVAAILGSTFVFGIILVATTLILDVLYAILDPRIRY
jgi:peptide/nickel transport system permease protein